MKESTAVGSALTVFVIVCLASWVAWYTLPESADPCSPHMIERHTNDLIAYRDCKALGEQCLITPSDTHRYNRAQASFDACVTEAVQ